MSCRWALVYWRSWAVLNSQERLIWASQVGCDKHDQPCPRWEPEIPGQSAPDHVLINVDETEMKLPSHGTGGPNTLSQSIQLRWNPKWEKGCTNVCKLELIKKYKFRKVSYSPLAVFAGCDILCYRLCHNYSQGWTKELKWVFRCITEINNVLIYWKIA